MKTLLVHNHYRQPGGEDVVAGLEKELLIAAGHRVVEYVRHSDEIRDYGTAEKLTLPLRTVWAWDSYQEMRAVLKRERPDLAHFHNTFPLISPAAYYACHEASVPVVQTLHNYRLFCPGATLFRSGAACEECLEHSLWRAVLHGCYRNSRLETSVVAIMLAVHRQLHTWRRTVDCFIAVSDFSRRKFIEGGIPAEKIAVKPNFVSVDPGSGARSGEYALFTGRLSPEKGLLTLLAAWQRLRAPVPLRVVGGGAEGHILEARARQMGLSGVRFLGQLPRDRVIGALRGALFLVSTSEWYETFGMALVEAFACAVPVICSRLGAMQEIVADGRTGLHFTPGDPEDLAAKVDWAWTHPEEMAAMGKAARVEYESKYTAERNYEMLMQIYQRALGTGESVGAEGWGDGPEL